MAGPNSTDWYEQHGTKAAVRYERLSFQEVHGWIIDLLPEDTNALVLDIGAGSGRDAHWFAERGHEVLAVEPSATIRREGQRRHKHPKLRWIDDRLPELSKTSRLGTNFDIILLSAVWMHVPQSERAQAFRKLTTLSKPAGLLAITLRHGPPEPERAIHEVTTEEVERLAREQGALVKLSEETEDRAGRPDVRWTHMAIRLPEDGAGIFPSKYSP